MPRDANFWRLIAAGSAVAVSTAAFVYIMRRHSGHMNRAEKMTVVEAKQASQASPTVSDAILEMLGDSLLLRVAEVAKPTASLLANKKVILLYMSAHWCSPCRGFTPKFIAAYQEYTQECRDAGGESEVAVVFISWDEDEESFDEYFGEMPWLAVPFASKSIRDSIGPRFDCEGIPHLVALTPDGSALHGDGDEPCDLRGLIEAHGGSAFPFTKPALSMLKAQLAARADAAVSKLLADSNVELIPPAHSESPASSYFSLRALCRASHHVVLLLGDGDASDLGYIRACEIIDAAADVQRVYIGWCLYDDSSDHAPLAADCHSIASLSGALRATLATLAGVARDVAVSTPHAIVLSSDACDGSSRLRVSSTSAIGRILSRGPLACPWSDEVEARLVADDQARRAEAKAAEETAMMAQCEAGGVVLQRLRGNHGAVTVEVIDSPRAGGGGGGGGGGAAASAAPPATQRRVRFAADEFATVAAPAAKASSGVLYYEVVLEALGGNPPQFGFASSAFPSCDGPTGEGVGDDALSWAVDGSRGLLWHRGERAWARGKPGSCWSVGDVIGIAASVDACKIAVSKNGSWSQDDGLGVVFENAAISDEGGVFPALTCGGFCIRYAYDSSHFAFAPPPSSVWSTSPP
jgi:thiol-disulfide isomerase/thioredoxin